MEDELTCSICLDIFTNPVMLTCSHNYCRSCILPLAKPLASEESADSLRGLFCGCFRLSGNGGPKAQVPTPRFTIKCPLCGQITVASKDTLACNLTVRNLAERVREKRDAVHIFQCPGNEEKRRTTNNSEENGVVSSHLFFRPSQSPPPQSTRSNDSEGRNTAAGLLEARRENEGPAGIQVHDLFSSL